MNMKDTIAAVSTPVGEGGIGIVRVSGAEALAIALKIFKGRGVEDVSDIEPRRLYYGRMHDNALARIDNGFMVYMNAPASYTGDDTVEFHCHGSPLVLRDLLAAVVRAGARLAEPGEFTKLAFLNGKLDLAQAEAVIDVIRAETDAALASARGRLEGVFSKRVRELGEVLVDLLAGAEAALDFPEDDVPESLDFIPQLASVEARLRRLINTFEEGRALRDGVRVLILGRPNVGKSSILNILLQEERAIVTPVPGTTRDVIEEAVNIRGIPIRLMDTAGLCETLDPVEAIGVRLAKERIARADLVLFVVDACGLADDDASLINLAEGRKLIVVANKTDLANADVRADIANTLDGCKVVFISALKHDGIEELKDSIYGEAVGHPYGAVGGVAPGELIVSLRHKEALANALQACSRARNAYLTKTPMECVAADLRSGLAALGEITGETTTEAILDRIFSGFCIGK